MEVNNNINNNFIIAIYNLLEYLNHDFKHNEFIRIKNYLNTIPNLNTINNLPKCIISNYGIIYLYEHYSDKKVKYNISDGVLSYFQDTPSNELYQYLILNQNNSFEKITIDKINEIGLYNLLKKQEWVFRCSNKTLIEKGKLIDIIRTNLKKYETSNNFKSLEVLYSMCSLESLESFNEISNN